MKNPTSKSHGHEHELIEEMEKLEKAVRASVIPPHKQMLRAFLSGMSSALGAVIAIAIVVPLLIFLLKDIQWIPLIGTFVEQISNYTQGKK